MRRSSLIAGLMLAMLMLTACGQKGPLRLPSDQPTSSTTATKPAS